MINITELRPGNTFEYEGNIFTCLDIELNKTAMAKMKVKVKSKNLRTGSITELGLIGGDKVDVVRLDKQKMGYLYDDGSEIVFMNNETYEQINVPKERLEWEVNFLRDGVEVEILTYEGEILGITLPAKVTLKVVESAPAVRGDTSKNALKDAVLETGLKTKVQLFIEEGDEIIVSTEDGSYVSRA